MNDHGTNGKTVPASIDEVDTAAAVRAAFESDPDRFKPGIEWDAYGIHAKAGDIDKVTFTAAIPEIAERFNFEKLFERFDFDPEVQRFGNRVVDKAHYAQIRDRIVSMADGCLHLGTLTVGLDPSGPVDIVPVFSPEEAAKMDPFFGKLVHLISRQGADKPVLVDGQHRDASVVAGWLYVRYADENSDDPEERERAKVRAFLARTEVEVTVLLTGDASELTTQFVRMARTRAIPDSLVVLMDQDYEQNILGKHVILNSDFLKDRTSYLATPAARRMAKRKGRHFDPLYPAAAVRSAACAIAGVGVNDRSPAQRESIINSVVGNMVKNGLSRKKALHNLGEEVKDALGYAFNTLPGWKDLGQPDANGNYPPGKISASKFKDKYVLSSSAALHVVANVIRGAKICGIAPERVLDELAKFPWRRDQLHPGEKDADGNQTMVHEFFENTLVATTVDEKTGEWRAGPAGATRSNYEPAIEKVLRELARRRRSEWAELGHLSTFKAIGLVKDGAKRGRPLKTLMTVAE